MKKAVLILISIAVFVLLVSFFAIFSGDQAVEAPASDQARETIIIDEEDDASENEEDDNEARDRRDAGTESSVSDDAVVGFEAPAEEISCEQKVKREAVQRDVNYYTGKAIVSFFESVTAEVAVETVTNLGYRPNEEQVSTYRQNYFFSVFVPEGEEFAAICNLRDAEAVKNATLDYKLDLVL